MESLSQRHNEILKAVIQAHALSGEAVGSQALCRAFPLELSPATVRNVMAELEELGYLHQPHTSAGRVPTERAFRHYVELLVEPAPLPAEFENRIREACAAGEGDIDETLGAASRVLATLTQCAALVSPPRLEETRLREVRFLGLPDGRVLALLVSATGQLQSRLFRLESDWSTRELDSMGRDLTRRLEGMTLRQVRASLLAEVRQEQASASRLRWRLLESVIRAVGQGDPGWGGLIVNGSVNLMRFPELLATSRLEEILQVLEEKRRLIHLLDRCLAAQGTCLFMGAETPLGRESGCAVVAVPYPGPGNHPWGSLGLLGPLRLDYAQAIPLLEFTARVLGEVLVREGSGHHEVRAQ